MITTTTIIHVESAHKMERQTRVSEQSHSSPPFKWSCSFSSLFLLYLCLCSLLLTSPLLSVTAARSKSRTPHLLHVRVQPLEMVSVVVDAAEGAHAGGQSVQSFALIRTYFDRAVQQHALQQQNSSAPMPVFISCPSFAPNVQLYPWVDASSSATSSSSSIGFVENLHEWMDYFDQSDSLDDDEDDEEDSSSALFPTGSVGAGGSAFAPNSFTLLLALPSLPEFSLKECTMSISMEALTNNAQGHKAVHVPLQPKKVDAAAQAKLPVRDRTFSTTYSSSMKATRWLLPHTLGNDTPLLDQDIGEQNDTSFAASCDGLRNEQRLVFLENGVTGIGAILGPIVSTMMAPVIEQMEQTSTVQTAEAISKNYVSTLMGSIPPETSHFVSASLSKGVTDMVVDLLTTSITASCSSSIAAALGAYLTRSVSSEVGEIVHDHILAAITQLVPPDLSMRLAVSVTKKLPQQIVKDVSMSLTQTLTGALTRTLSNLNHLQKMCRQCALFKHRCSDCKYVKDVELKTTHFSGQYSHYYAGYYSEYYAQIPGQMTIDELKPIIEDGPADGATRGIGGPMSEDGGGDE